MEKRKIFGIVTVVLVTILMIVPPAINAMSMSVSSIQREVTSNDMRPIEESQDSSEEPEVIIWRCHGFYAEKSVIKLSQEQALLLKQDYEKIDSAVERNELLIKHGILSKEDSLDHYNKEFQSFVRESNFNLPLLQKLYGNVRPTGSSLITTNILCFVYGDFSGFTISLPLGMPIDTYDGYLLWFLYVISITSYGPSYVSTIGLLFYQEISPPNRCGLFLWIFYGYFVMIPFIDLNGGSCAGFTLWALGFGD